MKRIQLTREKIAYVSNSDYNKVNKYKWVAKKGRNTYYAISYINGIEISMHRFILELIDSNIITDHKDGNGLNNQRHNLRTCIHAENMKNRKSAKNSSSKYLGVSLHESIQRYISKKTGIENTYYFHSWIAHIQVDNKCTHLGIFKTEIEAAIIYNIAARKYHGEFANPNKFK